MIDQSGFTGSQKAGNDSDWYFAGVVLAHGGLELRSVCLYCWETDASGPVFQQMSRERFK
jgi:hypothetical protein